MLKLRDYQEKAISEMKNGCILCGGVGSGKSITALGYYYMRVCGGSFDENGVICPMKIKKDLYIITTARKRDTLEWDKDMSPFMLSTNPKFSYCMTKVVVDSWNNISKYKDITNAFFIFDEQRVVGSGAWVKSFLKITKSNGWVLLSATPGDTWMDYIPVFIANRFYRNRTDFIREHVVYSRFSKFPKVDRYINTGKLIKYRNSLLIDMDFKRETISHHEDVYVNYDKILYKDTMKRRWDPYKDEPIVNAGVLCYILRRIVNSDESRLAAVMEIFEKNPRVIIFYNFDYELELLSSLYFGEGVEVAEWNGHRHQAVPESDSWVYLVQYTAGAEGWNCIKTDTIIFFSQNYSYKIMQQAAGRIDRLTTPYRDLYYYHLKTRSGIDLAISKALNNKQKFNERKYLERFAQ